MPALLSPTSLLVACLLSEVPAPADTPPAVSSTSEGSVALSPPRVDLSDATAGETRRFGELNDRRINLLCGFADDFDENYLGTVGVGLSWFFLDDLSIDIELMGIGVSQEGDDAVGFNPNLMFRWHFLARDTWSLYADGGCGLMIASDEVPAGGSSFNFTPQIGFGATYEIGVNTRLMAGIRWYHISNARLSEDNPGRDSVMVYAGVSFGF